MDCQWTRVRIPAFIDGELVEPELSRVRRHLGGCAKCAAALRREEALVERLRKAVGTETAPAGLPDRIGTSLDSEPLPAEMPAPAARRARRRSGVGWGALAAAAAVLLVLLAVPWAGTGPRFVAALAAEHAKLVEGDHYRNLSLVTGDNARIERFLTEKLGTRVELPVENVPAKRGACCCQHGGRKIGVVGCFCKKRGKAVTIFIARAAGLSTFGLRQVKRGNREFLRGSCGKCQAVLWRRGDLYYALVGTLEAEDIMNMARRAAGTLDSRGRRAAATRAYCAGNFNCKRAPAAG